MAFMVHRRSSHRWRIFLGLLLLMMQASQAFVPLHSRAPFRAPVLHTTNTATKESSASVTPPLSNNAAPKQHIITSHADWMELFWLDDDDEDTTAQKLPITAVSFHASWCRYCLKFQRKWNHKLVPKASHTAAAAAAVQFASVEYGANRKLCQQLKIEHLPTVHFYYGDSLLQSFPCAPKHFSQLPLLLEKYLAMSHDQLVTVTEEYETTRKAATVKMEPMEFSDDNDESSPSEPELFSRRRDRFRSRRDQLKEKLQSKKQAQRVRIKQKLRERKLRLSRKADATAAGSFSMTKQRDTVNAASIRWQT